MEVEVIHHTKVYLTLDENEARWLKGLLQNPLPNMSEKDKRIQELFFTEIHKELP